MKAKKVVKALIKIAAPHHQVLGLSAHGFSATDLLVALDQFLTKSCDPAPRQLPAFEIPAFDLKGVSLPTGYTVSILDEEDSSSTEGGRFLKTTFLLKRRGHKIGECNRTITVGSGPDRAVTEKIDYLHYASDLSYEGASFVKEALSHIIEIHEEHVGRRNKK